MLCRMLEHLDKMCKRLALNSACLVPSLCSLLAAIDVDGVLSVYDLVSNSAVRDEAIRSLLGDLCRFAVPCIAAS